MGFFDIYPRFLETSQTGVNLNRLNKRHDAIFRTNPAMFQGARVLDIASHDGRWSYCALKAGASHVVGVEPRAHLIQNSIDNLKHYGYSEDQFSFVQDDIFQYLAARNHRFDVVLCLGFFYHTYRHPELMHLIKKCAPQHLIMDTVVANDMKGLGCAVHTEAVTVESSASVDQSSSQDRTYVAVPSPSLLRHLMFTYGFSYTEVDWPRIIAGDPIGLEDFSCGRRMTLVCTNNDAAA
jgi:2-polyprenyl-3-methyl-5-hydroxy-6-metoxy-1,4-benzoquinol methylase